MAVNYTLAPSIIAVGILNDSFDEKNRLFQNSLGFHSQWFTKNELKSMLNSDVEPISIDVTINDVSYTFGNVFVDRNI